MISSFKDPFINELLDEQQNLTAVDRFSKKYDTNHSHFSSNVYSDLIPLSKPKKNEQYSFQIDLNACSGCKSCVSACHSLNGLDHDESWRDVGALFGTKSDKPMQQTVTTACHHCLDPACANGCPTLAYEKDQSTGIVHHLDDQCMGCRYCEMKCPYEAPKYNDNLGIIRKCDMCQSRLKTNEAPACVQACPNEAIKIRIVRNEEILEETNTDEGLVPGTITSQYTKPSSQYINLKKDSNPRPADYGNLKQSASHSPLMLMLTFTQAGVGISLIEFIKWLVNSQINQYTLLTGIALCFIGLLSSFLHLGKPSKAWKAFLGWRRSWLSREILIFGLWSVTSLTFLFFTLSGFANKWITISGAISSLLGILGIYSSVMVYADTPRPSWNFKLTCLRFFSTTLGVGIAFSGWFFLAAIPMFISLSIDIIIMAGKNSNCINSGRLMRGPLKNLSVIRISTAIIAIALLAFSTIASAVLFFVSEIFGRSLFFRSSDEPKMPGLINS